MTAHRCSDSVGWNERLTLMHANEGKCKECELFITARPGDQESQPPFIWGLKTSKGHVKDEHSHRTELCKHILPIGITCQLHHVCLHMPAFKL